MGPEEALAVYLYGSLTQKGLFSAEPDKQGLAVPVVLWDVASLKNTSTLFCWLQSAWSLPLPYKAKGF